METPMSLRPPGRSRVTQDVSRWAHIWRFSAENLPGYENEFKIEDGDLEDKEAPKWFAGNARTFSLREYFAIFGPDSQNCGVYTQRRFCA